MYEDALNYEPIVDRLFAVEGPPQDCWLWDGPVTRQGLPVVYRKVDGRGQHLRVRVLSLTRRTPRPDGWVTKDVCGEGLCVNPAHLRWVPRSANPALYQATQQCPGGHSKLPGARCKKCNGQLSREALMWRKAAAATLGLSTAEYTRRHGTSKYIAQSYCD